MKVIQNRVLKKFLLSGLATILLTGNGGVTLAFVTEASSSDTSNDSDSEFLYGNGDENNTEPASEKEIMKHCSAAFSFITATALSATCTATASKLTTVGSTTLSHND